MVLVCVIIAQKFSQCLNSTTCFPHAVPLQTLVLCTYNGTVQKPQAGRGSQRLRLNCRGHYILHRTAIMSVTIKPFSKTKECIRPVEGLKAAAHIIQWILSSHSDSNKERLCSEENALAFEPRSLYVQYLTLPSSPLWFVYSQSKDCWFLTEVPDIL